MTLKNNSPSKGGVEKIARWRRNVIDFHFVNFQFCETYGFEIHFRTKISSFRESNPTDFVKFHWEALESSIEVRKTEDPECK